MTAAEMLTRMGEIRDELDTLAGHDTLTEEQESRWSELTAEFDTLNDAHTRAAERADQLARYRAAVDAGTVRSVTGTDTPDADPLGEPGSIRNGSKIRNPWDLDELRTSRYGSAEEAATQLRGRAIAAVEQTTGLSDRAREKVVGLLESLDIDDDESTNGAIRAARHIVAVSSPDYTRAFSRALRTFGRTGQADVDSLRTLQRAMSLTDAAGGFAVPLPIDPTLILDDNGSVNPFRQISTVRQIVTDQLRTVNSGAVTFSWDGEAAEVSDDATTFATTDITVHKAQGFIPFSIEVSQDYPGFTEDLRMLLADGRDNLEATAFATGSGTNQPVGIVTALQGGSFEVGSNTTDVFALGDVYDLEEELPARFRANASWVANKRIYQAIREAGGANLDDFWANLGSAQPASMLGYPAYESSAMDGVIDAAADNRVLVLGDFRNYWIVDRIGLSIELVPHMFHTSNNRPSGQRGFYAHWRVGADSVRDRAFRLLNVT